jgi:hypothetical protein
MRYARFVRQLLSVQYQNERENEVRLHDKGFRLCNGNYNKITKTVMLFRSDKFYTIPLEESQIRYIIFASFIPVTLIQDDPTLIFLPILGVLMSKMSVS